MKWIGRFLRQCPSCKRLFAVKRISREPVDSMDESTTIRHQDRADLPGPFMQGRTPASVPTDEQVGILEQEFLDTYQCMKCDYKWSERRIYETKFRSGQPTGIGTSMEGD